MCEEAPFGARADVMCCTVPGDPRQLVVGGGAATGPRADVAVLAGEAVVESRSSGVHNRIVSLFVALRSVVLFAYALLCYSVPCLGHHAPYSRCRM